MPKVEDKQTNGSAGTASDSECVRLRDRIKELELEIAQERQKCAALQEERDELRSSLLAWSRSQITQGELIRWATEVTSEEDSVPFEEIMAQLRKGPPTPQDFRLLPAHTVPGS